MEIRSEINRVMNLQLMQNIYLEILIFFATADREHSAFILKATIRNDDAFWQKSRTAQVINR